MHKHALFHWNFRNVALRMLLIAPRDDVWVSVGRTVKMDLAHRVSPTAPEGNEPSIERERFTETRETNAVYLAGDLTTDGNDRSQLRIVRNRCDIDPPECWRLFVVDTEECNQLIRCRRRRRRTEANRFLSGHTSRERNLTWDDGVRRGDSEERRIENVQIARVNPGLANRAAGIREVPLRQHPSTVRNRGRTRKLIEARTFRHPRHRKVREHWIACLRIKHRTQQTKGCEKLAASNHINSRGARARFTAIFKRISPHRAMHPARRDHFRRFVDARD